METTTSNRRKRLPVTLAGSPLTGARGFHKPPQPTPQAKPIKVVPTCPHGLEAKESDWHEEGKYYRAKKCFKCHFPTCLHDQYLTEEDIRCGAKQCSTCPVCFPPYFSTNVKAWNTTLSKAGFGYGRGMSMVEEVKPLADGSVKISGYSKNLCTGGGSKDMELNDVKAEFGSDDVGHRGEDDFDEADWVDDTNDPVSSKSESAQYKEALSDSIGDTGPSVKYEICKITSGRFGLTENGELIREFTSRAAVSRHLKKVKAEISAELKHKAADLDYELQQIAFDVDGSR